MWGVGYREFLAGAVMMAFFAVSIFFLRYWKQTRDRLFAAFAASFFLLSLEKVLLHVTRQEAMTDSFVYTLRLIAFLLIAGAIIDKNRGIRRPPTDQPA